MKKSIRYPLLFSLIISIMITFSSFAAATTEASDPITDTLYLLNECRLHYGLPQLTLDTKILPVSDIRVSESASLFSHTRPDGRRYSTAFSDCNVCYQYCGEILAYGYQTPEQVINAWMASPGHRSVILSSHYKKVGISRILADDNRIYWAIEFLSE